MKAPMTEDNLAAWRAMVESGMDKAVLLERLADWARMLEERVAELDPQYQSYPWGRNPRPQVVKVSIPPRYEISSSNVVDGEVVSRS